MTPEELNHLIDHSFLAFDIEQAFLLEFYGAPSERAKLAVRTMSDHVHNRLNSR